MLKKIICVGLCISVLFGIWFNSKTPVFQNYSDTFELYIGSASSNSKIITVKKQDFPFVGNIRGESVVLKKDISVIDILSSFNAQLVFSESTAEGVSFYAYSKNIKYTQNINDKKVNLHVFVANEYIKIGSPLIYGSF